MYRMSTSVVYFWFCLTLYTNIFIRGELLSFPDFQTGWMPIKNGLKHIARIDVSHGLNEVPVLVDVSVKVRENIFPATGFRPDHPDEMSGPVVYIYNDRHVNVSTSPNTDSLYQVIPTSSSFYQGYVERWEAPVFVRVRAWKRSTLPSTDFEASGMVVKAKTGSVSDSYIERSHGMDSVPCLVVTRAKMSHPTDGSTLYSDGVGSSMETFSNVTGMTNAYLVYGYNHSQIRVWVDSSTHGAVFDGKKHTWFDFVIYNAEVEIFAWKCSNLEPMYNKRITTKYTADKLPSWQFIDVDYKVENSLVRIMAVGEDLGGPNVGFWFPASMHITYPADSSDGYQSIKAEFGGLSYSYKENGKVEFWKPSDIANRSVIFVGSTFGGGRNTETSNTESVYAISWMTAEATDCQKPVIYKASINSSENVFTRNTTLHVECLPGYHLVRNSKYFIYDDLEENEVKCDKFGVWNNVPSCKPNEKALGETCNPAEDTCWDVLASCVLNSKQTNYQCQCMDGYTPSKSHCTKEGTFLPPADFDSGWKSASYSKDHTIDLEFEHELDETPILVDVQVRVENNFIFPALGFRPDNTRHDGSTTVFIYDDRQIRVTGVYPSYIQRLISIHNTRWTGWSNQWSTFGEIRARAWKAKSLPDPDFMSSSTTLRANTSFGSDSFSEISHQLGEYPGLVVVRAKMLHDAKLFYAHGVGSALNVYHDMPGVTNSFLVYGYNDESVRMWVDSSSNGVIFDGRKSTLFNFTVNEAEVEIIAWKISTLTPYFTYRFPLYDFNVPNDVKFRTNYDLPKEMNMAWFEVDEANSIHKGFRFPGSTYLASRFSNRNKTNDDCVFGGFMYGVGSINIIQGDAKKYETLAYLYRPDPADKDMVKGSTVCIPRTFGNGQKSGSASNGFGILYSWTDPECGTPDIDNGIADTSVNGTYLSSIATVTCNEGYHLNRDTDKIQCLGSQKRWQTLNKSYSTTKCIIDECIIPDPPNNGSIIDTNRKYFGENVTFACDDGFNLIGSNVIECQAGGNWSGELPTCEYPTTTKSPVSSARSLTTTIYMIQTLIMLYLVFT